MIQGWGRLIYYLVEKPTYFEGTNHEYNPTVPDSNKITKIYESYLENGQASEYPTYGRYWMKGPFGNNCNIGFLSYKENPRFPALKGKGIMILPSHTYSEGLWEVHQPTTVNVTKTITDFDKNEFVQS